MQEEGLHPVGKAATLGSLRTHMSFERWRRRRTEGPARTTGDAAADPWQRIEAQMAALQEQILLAARGPQTPSMRSTLSGNVAQGLGLSDADKPGPAQKTQKKPDLVPGHSADVFVVCEYHVDIARVRVRDRASIGPTSSRRRHSAVAPLVTGQRV